MSTDRRWDSRRFRLLESTTLNNGARTIFLETMPAATSVPPHYHNRFSETFDLISGAMTVFQSPDPDLEILAKSAVSLEIGKLVTVKPGTYHQYKAGDQTTTVRVTITPGDRDFERLLCILDGLAEDGEAVKFADDVVLMAVLMDLANGNVIGPAGEMLGVVYEKQGEEVRARKEDLLGKYDNEVVLGRLMGRD